MNKAIAILVVTTVAPAVACLHLVRELREERAQTESLLAKVAELEKAASQSQVFTVLPRATPFSPPLELPPTDSRSAEPTASAEKASEASGKQVAAATLIPDSGESMREHLERRRAMLKNPAYRDALRARTRLGMSQSYPGLAAELDMSKEEADRFLDLLADQQVRDMEHHEAAFLANGTDEAAMRDAQQRFQERVQQQQAELETHLGPAKYQQWQEYQQTLGQRHRLASVQSKLALTGAPLNAEQSQALLSALVQEQQKQQQAYLAAGSTPQVVGMITTGDPAGTFSGQEEWLQKQAESNERLLSSVKSSLSSEQFSQLEEMLNSELEVQRMHLELQESQGDSVGRVGLRMVAPYANQVVVETSSDTIEAR